MNGSMKWSPLQRVLFTSAMPVAALVAGIALFGLARSGGNSTPRADSAPAAASRPAGLNAADAARESERTAFRNCLQEMGVLGGSRVPGRLSRFSRRPDQKKIQEAISFCRTLIQPGGGPSKPAPRRPITPPIA